MDAGYRPREADGKTRIRDGKLAGAYRKTHLHWPEYRDGVTPGDEYPVFETDFGTIGLMICYDSWWPESARVLALRGAHIVGLARTAEKAQAAFDELGLDKAKTTAIKSRLGRAINKVRSPWQIPYSARPCA